MPLPAPPLYPYTHLPSPRAPSPQGQVHGCPFKTFGQESLRAALARMQVAPAQAEEAAAKAKAGHYQLACAAAWEGQHGGCSCDSGINHPNQVRALVCVFVGRGYMVWVEHCAAQLRY